MPYALAVIALLLGMFLGRALASEPVMDTTIRTINTESCTTERTYTQKIISGRFMGWAPTYEKEKRKVVERCTMKPRDDLWRVE